MPPAAHAGRITDGGFSALVVEDEALIAAGLEGLLQESGATRVVWAPRHDEALSLIGRSEAAFSVAVVDWLLGAHSAEAVVTALVAAGTPVLIYTGTPETVVVPADGRVAVLGKPARDTHLLAAIMRLLGGG